METKAGKVMVDQLAEDVGSLEGNVTSIVMYMSKINQKVAMVKDESLEKNKRTTHCGKGLARKQRKGGRRSSQ